ncbi:MAG: hypothetical protein LH606_17200 [Cytophagaceae bacterium]|nr:hypothetical protein [Cytophagaceae bacterium]
MNKGYVVILLFFYSCSLSLAQYDKLAFEAITTKQGLSGNSVTSMVQDKEGFMWFGTAVGLNKYNGHNFTVFRSSPQKAPNTLHNDVIWDLHEDRKGRLWISTLGDGLYKLDKQTQNLSAHRLNPSRDSAYMNIFYSIHEESAKVLWIGSQLGLVRFDLETKKMRLYPFPAPNDYKVVFCLTEDQGGRLWVGTKVGLYYFDRKTGQYSAVPLTNQSGLKQPLVSALYIDSEGILWVGTNGEALFKLGSQGEGLFKVDTQSPLLKTSSYNPAGLVNKNIALNGIINHSGHVWVATDDGLQRINPRTHQVLTYRADRFSANTLSSSTILSLYQDRDGNLWVGTDNGVNKIVNNTKQFFSYQLKSTMPSVRIIDNSVNTVFQDQRGTIWLGNHVKGLYQFDPYTGRIAHKPADPTNPRTLLSNHVWSIFQDHRKQVWVGTLEGVHRLNPATGETIRYPSKIPTQYITEDLNGQLWVGGKKGVASFNPVTGQYSYLDTTVTAGFNYVTNLMVSRAGDLWIAQQGLLQRYDIRTRAQVFFSSSFPLKAGELTDRNVSMLFEDSRGLIWVGTERGGLNYFNPTTKAFSAFTTEEGLPSNFISGITEDKNGNLWVSTNKGISRLTVKTKTLRNYDATDGLPEMEFNTSSVNRSHETLLFGGSNGFVLFNPDSVRDNTIKPPVYITGVKIHGKSRPLLSSQLILPYNENSLSFDFVALNYQSPEKNRYAYKLEGLEEDWVDSGFRRFASYPGLSPGTYIFRVKASNNDGIWNTRGTSLTISISRPWWLTGWAYLLYALLFVGAVGAFIRSRSLALQQKNRLLEEKVTERTQQIQYQKEEIEAQRDNLEHTLTELKATQAQLIQSEKMASLGELTAGIAHEIQNPLNFVNNFSEVSTELVSELREEHQRSTRDLDSEGELLSYLEQNLQKITQHGQRASAIVKGMLEHSRTSSGEKQPTDLNALAEEYLRLAYHGLRAKDKDFNAELKTNFDAHLGEAKVVPQEIGRVLLNLFNNAFYAVAEKKKQATDDYRPIVSVSTQRVGNQIKIKVEDNGMGIAEAVKTKIFQPFFTTKPTGQGTGLGLSLSYDIVTKGHGGTLTVESTPGQGTEFSIYLPVAPTTV